MWSSSHPAVGSAAAAPAVLAIDIQPNASALRPSGARSPIRALFAAIAGAMARPPSTSTAPISHGDDGVVTGGSTGISAAMPTVSMTIRSGKLARPRNPPTTSPPSTDPTPHTAVSTPAIAGRPRSRAQAMISMSTVTSGITTQTAATSVSTRPPSLSSDRPLCGLVIGTGSSSPARRSASRNPNVPATASTPHTQIAVRGLANATSDAAIIGPTMYMNSCSDASTVYTACCTGPVASRG